MDTVCGVSPSGIASGVSCIFTFCLFENTHWLCTIVNVPGFPHSVHLSGGSLTRPRSTCTCSGENPHIKHLKNASLRSGMMGVHLVTMPRTHTILSMSEGFKSRIGFASIMLYGRTMIRIASASSSPTSSD